MDRLPHGTAHDWQDPCLGGIYIALTSAPQFDAPFPAQTGSRGLTSNMLRVADEVELLLIVEEGGEGDVYTRTEGSGHVELWCWVIVRCAMISNCVGLRSLAKGPVEIG